jgi:hypothetical protein
MPKQDEYRQYADEAMKSARTARDPIRQHFLDLAKIWRTAAQQIDDSTTTAPQNTAPRP